MVVNHVHEETRVLIPYVRTEMEKKERRGEDNDKEGRRQRHCLYHRDGTANADAQ